MDRLNTWLYSTHRYTLNMDTYNSETGETYVKIQMTDWHPDPDQKWSGLMQEFTEADFCRFMWEALERKRRPGRQPEDQEANP